MTDVATHPVFGSPLADGWITLTVDDVKADEPSSCVAGPFGSNISKKYFAESGIPVIRGFNLTNDRTRFVPRGFVFVTPERAQSYKPQHVVGGDLVFTCWGTVGQVGLIPHGGPYPAYIISNKQLKLRSHSGRADPLFLFYYFASDEMVRYIRNRAIGAAVPGINLGILKSLPVVLPPLFIQRKIAAVLAAYDELIENSLRRIEILEEMAQAVYREWFVEFRFPGHEDVAIVESELGPIPERWEVITFGEAFEILGGATPSTKKPEFWHDGTVNWYTPSDLTAHGQMFIRESSRKITDAGLDRCSSTLFPPGSVMMTSRATLGVLAINTDPACTNQGFITALPNERVTTAFLYQLLASMADEIESLATGATFKEITKRNFRSIRFRLAPRDLIQRFTMTVGPLHDLSRNLIEQNANLRATRDLLLPKLVSGQIDVSDFDIDTDWLVA